jgi:hypothetical protein
LENGIPKKDVVRRQHARVEYITITNVSNTSSDDYGQELVSPGTCGDA